MSWLNYHHLMYFRTIAAEGSISKASEKLFVGQPALSAQLKQLEEALGTSLFERRNRGLHLTEAGKVTLQYANQIYSMGKEMQSVLSSKSFSPHSVVKIGALDSVPKTVITDLVEYTRSLGVSKVVLLEGSVEELSREMVNANMDLILSNYSLILDDANIVSVPIGKSQVSLYGSKAFLKLKKEFPLSLDQAPFILPTGHSKLRHDLEHYFDLKKIKPLIVAEVQDTAVQKHLAIDGVGLIALPEFSASNLLHYKKLYEIAKMDEIYEEYWLISSKRVIKNNIVSKILEGYPKEISL